MDSENQASRTYVLVSGSCAKRKSLVKDEYDVLELLRTLLKARKSYDLRILGFCILPREFHLVIMCHPACANAISKQVSDGYNLRYGQKYKPSKPILSAGCTITRYSDQSEVADVMRTIWRMPLDQGLSPDIEGYPWSSYRLLRKPNSYIDVPDLEHIMPQSNWQLFAQEPGAACIGKGKTPGIPRSQACTLLNRLAATRHPRQIRALPDHIIGTICLKASRYNISKRQLSEILGMSRYRIDKLMALASKNGGLPT